ncbi:MAG: methylated-DNA--[protein]-cysteine S-methyltransferase [Coriobacteriia bacterium]|nr:methylated-DNA--[protein]-cysteine S-methyltransferase [Coriobacteriia bacterium]
MKNVFFTFHETPLGDVIVTCNDDSITGLWFASEQRHLPTEQQMSDWGEQPDNLLLMRATSWLDSYFACENPPVELPLAFTGTEFQIKVWLLLCSIGYGQTTTYLELAQQLQHQEKREVTPAAQAIGQAVGRNPISLIVPCHRVIGRNGSLTGYGGGLERKRFLLDLELI